MMLISSRHTLAIGQLIAAIPLLSGCSLGPGFADLPKEWQEVSLLNGRLLARLPKTAQWGPTNHSVMEAPPPSEQELRVQIDSGSKRLVALVTELYRIAPVAFDPLGRAYKKSIEQRLHLDQLSIASNSRSVNGLGVFDYEPREKTKVDGNTHLLMGILIRHPDASLQSIEFFVNDEGLSDRAAARQLATDIIASLRPGLRKLPTDGRFRVTGSPLTLELPPQYTAYLQRGPDFNVYWIEHLVALDQAAGRLGIYTGHHPQRSAHPKDARPARTVLFGRDAEWRIWEKPAADQRSVIFWQEAFVPGAESIGTFHVFFHALTPAERAAFEHIAEKAAYQ